MGWFKKEKVFPKGIPASESSTKRMEFIASIRWKGEIYCPACGSALERVPVSRNWYNDPVYDPMTGAELSWVGRHGEAGLMVCSKWEHDRKDPRYSMLGDNSFQGAFEKMDKECTRHGMYYTDTPPL